MRTLKRILKSDTLPLLVAGLGATLLVAALYVLQPGILRYLDYKLYDFRLRWHHASDTSGVPVIVDIDEKSLAAYGQWPWPRYRLAMLLERIRDAGALAVGLDIVLAEPDRTSPVLLKLRMKKDLGLDVDITGLPRKLEDHDALLAEVLRDKPYALSFYFSFLKDEADHQAQGGGCDIKPARVAVLAEPGATALERALTPAYGAVCPLPELAEAASATGFFNATPDPDGILRRVALLTPYQGKLYPSLALATLMQAGGGEGGLLRLRANGFSTLSWGGAEIPLDRHGRILVHYRGGAGSFPYVSAADLLAGRADPAMLKGRIVFVGTSAAGLKDLRATPFSPVCPGVEVHATVADNILRGDIITVPDYAQAMELLATLAAGLGVFLLVTRLRTLAGLFLVVLAGAGLWAGADVFLGQRQVYLSLLYPYLSLAANFSLLTLLRFLRAEKQKKFIQGAFSHYLAPAVIQQILDSGEDIGLQGQEKEVSILFSDVRNFTALCEGLTPTQVTDLLHDYLTPMTRVITEHMGTLDKFIGDAVMAFWNAPLDVPEHPKKALAAALRMFEELGPLNERFQDKYGLTIRIGVGLHCGKVHVGNMGSQELFDYTLIGDNVNLASRLEDLTKFYGQKLLLSQAMVTACGDMCVYQEMDRVRVKGRAAPVTISTALPRAEAEAKAQELARHAEALALYRARRFADAQAAFLNLLAATGNETLYAMYAERCGSLMRQPPPEDWDGVFTHRSK